MYKSLCPHHPHIKTLSIQGLKNPGVCHECMNLYIAKGYVEQIQHYETGSYWYEWKLTDKGKIIADKGY